VEPAFARADVGPEFVVGAAVQGGWVAAYAPGVLDGEWGAFELDLGELHDLVPERLHYRDVITFPPVRQDLAFVVDESVPAGELIAAAREAAGDELREVRFLSDYRGDPIPDGRKSIAFSVAFQSAERTLTDEDAARLRAAIVAAVAERFDGDLRGG
jgi:phenylalanyl-tRNA synthetase beta chain